VDDIDTTKYVTDPFTGEPHSPPDNKDQNIYAFFPSGEQESAGASLHIPTSKTTGKSGPVNQGILWWIRKINPSFQPWYWFATVQEYEAFSYFGSPPDSTPTKWGYRGFQYFNFFPVIWILSVNNPLRPMGSFGSPSLDACARAGDWSVEGKIPTAPLGVNGSGTFAPFGLLPMFDPPLDPSLFDQEVPNIWQLTGVQQPNLANPRLPWDRIHNPYLAPSTKVAEQCAKTFAANWQSVATGVNGALEGLQGTPYPIGNPPPGWNWATPWTFPHGPAGYPHATWGSFQNGIQPGLINADGDLDIPPEIFVPASTWTLNADQLDPKVWDTKPSTEWPISLPPVLWSQKDGHAPYGFTQP
jgi:hypothetical protein